MPVLSINYDLKAPGKNYEDLLRRLRGFPKWSHVQDSFWLIQTALDKDDVYAELKKYMDSSDSLFVMTYTHAGAVWTGNQNETTEDIQNTLNED
ncbi:MAG: hypothetical protein ABF453_02935 [Bifidobacterium psychraerophilum]